MYKIKTLKNGLTLITVDLPHLDSVTTLVAVGAGSRYETKNINGISHFLEHMFFKGSEKYPTTEIISTLVDGIGAVSNAATSKEFTFYWIKSAAKHLELATDIISSLLISPLFEKDEIEREKGVIIEEMRMIRDNAPRYIWDLYEKLQFGDQPLGWEIIGTEETINKTTRANFIDYVESLYSPKNMALIYAGKLPHNIEKIAEKFFSDLPKRAKFKSNPFKKAKQLRPKTDIFYKKVDQANLVLGMEGYNRQNPKKYAAKVLSVILGEGMSSRLFMQVRERRGLAYHVASDHESLTDTGIFAIYAGLKLEKVYEGLAVIKSEIEKLVKELATEAELKKAKESIRGRLALRSESTNFLAEHFGVEFVLDGKLESFEDYMKEIDRVTLEDVQKIAQELFRKENYNLQIIGPFKAKEKFEKILNS